MNIVFKKKTRKEKKKKTVVKSKKIIVAIFYTVMACHLKDFFGLDLVFETASK